ncbi:MAG: tRNA pseudouridine(55) synthase TruB [bacterium]|nr:tRNA pseudouridine(55) synthase TruB [bacterium]
MSFLNFFKQKKEKTLPEILLIDKPKGITSFDVIRELKKRYGDLKIGHAQNLKIGHAGTLDPLATGLLIIGVGDGTKKMGDFLKLSKVYEVHILLGIKTDTGDLDGKIIEEKIVSFIDGKEVERIFKNLVGDIVLAVPVYSAVKQKGVPLYKRARRGEIVVPPEKKMHIERMELLGIVKEGGRIILFAEMEVGSGTYVRSIVEEIGKRLGVPATVKELRRTKIGDFDVRDAQKL